MLAGLFHDPVELGYVLYPTNHEVYDDIPFRSVDLKLIATGGNRRANIVQLTRYMAYFKIDAVWWRFPGKLLENPKTQDDSRWRWAKMVRRNRCRDDARFIAVRTEDGHVQGAAWYGFEGRSFLDDDATSIYVERLATAPRSRRDFVQHPAYRGIGEGLLVTIVAHSYDLGYGGRVTLDSFPGAVDFYRRHGFEVTSDRSQRMIGMELTPRAADQLLARKGLIR